jgi:hypothetical protein
LRTLTRLLESGLHPPGVDRAVSTACKCDFYYDMNYKQPTPSFQCSAIADPHLESIEQSAPRANVISAIAPCSRFKYKSLWLLSKSRHRPRQPPKSAHVYTSSGTPKLFLLSSAQRHQTSICSLENKRFCPPLTFPKQGAVTRPCRQTGLLNASSDDSSSPMLKVCTLTNKPFLLLAFRLLPTVRPTSL